MPRFANWCNYVAVNRIIHRRAYLFKPFVRYEAACPRLLHYSDQITGEPSKVKPNEAKPRTRRLVSRRQAERAARLSAREETAKRDALETQLPICFLIRIFHLSSKG